MSSRRLHSHVHFSEISHIFSKTSLCRDSRISETGRYEIGYEHVRNLCGRIGHRCQNPSSWFPTWLSSFGHCCWTPLFWYCFGSLWVSLWCWTLVSCFPTGFLLVLPQNAINAMPCLRRLHRHLHGRRRTGRCPLLGSFAEIQK